MSAKKNNRNTEFARRSLLSAAVLMVTAGQSGMVSAQEGFLEGWEVHGYLRQYLSFNLEDPYLGDPATGGTTSKGDYKYDLSMARSVGKLNLYKDMGNSQLFISGRVPRKARCSRPCLSPRSPSMA